MRSGDMADEGAGGLDEVTAAIEAIAAGELVIVVDDDDRENEGDLIMAASRATPEQVAFMIRHTSGILCAPLLPASARRLRLDPMVSANDAPLGTAFTVSVDYRYGLTTGISAEERAATIRALANDNAGAEDFVRPGHIFPLIAREGGVLIRSGHTEAAVDLARLAGEPPVGLIAELVNDDGTVKRLPELRAFARAHGLKIVSIADLIEHRQRREHLVSRVAGFDLETAGGPARAIVYETPFDAMQHVALVFGEIGDGRGVLARLHREQAIEDLFVAAPRATTIASALDRLGREGRGVFVYLRNGLATFPSEAAASPGEAPSNARTRHERWVEVGTGAQILRDLGVLSIRLLAAHHRHYIGLSGFGIDIEATELLGP
jgi:3,4-dihydroxy 2-butanone 4-phosphate synthase/GTP cyclohydrolase II